MGGAGMVQETVIATTSTVACEGNDPPLGHPRVYLTFKDGSREIVCPYCSRRFQLADGVKPGPAH